MSSLFLQACPESAILCPEYRLSSAPGGRFPAALQDAVTAYSFLVHGLDIPPQDIVLSGDSAGAHLAIGLLRYINTNPDILPEPAALLLWSPWPDMIIDVDIADERPATHVDHVVPELIAWAYREFLPRAETGIARSDPYLSPVTAAIPTDVPIWVQWGAAEILRPEVKNLCTYKRVVRGTPVLGHAKFLTPLMTFLPWRPYLAGSPKRLALLKRPLLFSTDFLRNESATTLTM